MRRPVRAEVRKILGTRSLLAAPAVCLAYAVLSLGPALTAPAEQRATLPPDLLVDAARGTGAFVAVVMLLLGVLATAGEHRHGTLAASLVVTPRRRDLLAAKASAVALVAAVTAVAVEVVSLSLGRWYASANDVALTSPLTDVLVTALAVVAGAVLYGLLGVAVGTLLRDQTLAIGGALAWVGIVEGVVPVVLRTPWLFRWMPTGALNGVLGVTDERSDLLPAWGAALLLLAVGGVLLTAAATAFARRDVATAGE